MPFFSVVIPLYNKQSFISDAMQSVLSQTFSNFELLIVDDGSTDRSIAQAQKFNDQRIRIISHQGNKGLSAARNTGWQNASGSLVAFLDADDLWLPEFLENIAALTAEFPQAGIFATAYCESYRQRQLPVKTNLHLSSETLLVLDFFAVSLFQPIYWFGSAVVRKEVFETVGGFDTSITFGEDTDFNIRANLKFALAYSKKIGAVYRIESENQITRSNFAARTFTDFDKYEPLAKTNPSLKKFLDANRYFLALNLKLSGNREKAAEMSKNIELNNLTSRQRMLLKAPIFVARLLRGLKKMLLSLGFRATSFSG